jgi:predicted ribosome-associated RNA-binding protein Tma20/translation initiation factor 1 (eIF-1/SUI1)
MFHKAHDVAVSSRSLMRAKDAKGFRELVGTLFPGVPSADLDGLLFPSGSGKHSLESTKFATKLVGYGVPDDKSPLFVDLDPKAQGSRLLPTLHALWRRPALLPHLIIPSQVSPYLIGGADLMLQGVLVPPEGGLPAFPAGAFVAIRVAGNPAPVAVGEAVVSSSAAAANGMKGRGVRVLHHYGDALWDAGGRVRPNDGFRGNVVAGIEAEAGGASAEAEGEAPAAAPDADSGAGSGAGAGAGAAAAASTDGAPEAAPPGGGEAGVPAPSASSSPPPPWWTRLDPDALLTATFLQALRRRVRSSDLPMLANVLVGVHMAACKPKGLSVDAKKTAWKKLPAFLLHMQGLGVCTVEDDPAKGTTRLLSIDRAHPLYKAHKPWPASAEEAASAAASAAEDGEDGDEGGAAAGGASAWLPPVVAQYLQPQRPAAITVTTVLAALAVRKGPEALPGVLIVKGRRRGGPKTAAALSTRILRVADVVARRWAGAQKDGEEDEEEDEEEEDEETAADGTAADSGVSAGSAAAAAAPGGAPATAAPAAAAEDKVPSLATLLGLLPPVTSVLFTPSEVQGLLNEYVALRRLADPSDKKAVRLDEQLAASLAGQVSAAPSSAAAAEGADDVEGGEEEAEAASAVAGDDAGVTAACLPFDPSDLSTLAAPPAELADSPSLQRDQVVRLWASRMARWHTVTYRTGGAGAQDEIYAKKGRPPPVTVSVKRIQGGTRAQTHCLGADDYRVDLAHLAASLQRAVAAAATVGPCPTNPSRNVVVVLGAHAERVGEVLESEFGVPHNCIKVVDEEEAGKGKKGSGGKGGKGK